MKSKAFILYISIFLMLLTTGYLLWTKKTPAPAVKQAQGIQQHDIETERILEIQQQLQGKKLDMIESIVFDSLVFQDQKACLFLFHASDCSDCVAEAFNMIKYIDGHYGKQMVWSICDNNGDPKKHQAKFNYNRPIYCDYRGSLYQQLYYFYTPVFLLIDKQRRIQQVYYPRRGDEARFQKDFLAALGL